MDDDKNAPANIGFNQTGWVVQGDVYNVNGNLILNKNSSKDDFCRVLSDLSAEVSHLQGVPAYIQQQVQSQLNAATESDKNSADDKTSIISHLNDAKDALQSVDSAAESVMSLAKTITKITAWVAAFLI